MNKLLILSLLALGYQTASAQLVTESFGSGANAFTIDFVTIGNPNNVADTMGIPNPAGSVAYTYNLGKYELSRDMITKANAAGSLGITLADMSDFGGNGVNRPATGISWLEAAKFVNWLNTSSGNAAAYKFDGSGNFQLWAPTDAGYNANNKFRNSLAKYVIASRDEWYKGAHGSPNGTWYNYPTGSDSNPSAVASGTFGNTLVYGQFVGPADITSAGGLSAYGTMGQGGNAWEWMETAHDGSNDSAGENLEMRGGYWNYYSSSASLRTSRVYVSPSNENSLFGFRVAMIPGKESMTLYLYTAADQTKGGLSVNPSQSSYISGDLVAVSASPLPGYLFSNWSGDISGTTASVTLTMNSNKNITANFGEDTRDSDADGLSNYQEIIIYGTNPNQKDTNFDSIEDGQAVALGYSPTFNFSALISHLQSHPPTGLYTATQMQAMAIGDLVLTKNANGSFTLNYDIEQSTDLQSWLPYQSFNQQITNLPPDKAFIRIKAKQ